MTHPSNDETFQQVLHRELEKLANHPRFGLCQPTRSGAGNSKEQSPTDSPDPERTQHDTLPTTAPDDSDTGHMSEASEQTTLAENTAVLEGMDIQTHLHSQRMEEIQTIIGQQNEEINNILQGITEQTTTTREHMMDQNKILRQLQQKFADLHTTTHATEPETDRATECGSASEDESTVEMDTTPETTISIDNTMPTTKRASNRMRALYGDVANTPAFASIFGTCDEQGPMMTDDAHAPDNETQPNNHTLHHPPTVRHSIIHNPLGILLARTISDPFDITKWARDFKTLGKAHGVDDHQLLTSMPTRFRGTVLEAYHTLQITEHSTFDSVIRDLKACLRPKHTPADETSLDRWKRMRMNDNENPNEFYLRVFSRARLIREYYTSSQQQQTTMLLHTFATGCHKQYRHAITLANPTTGLQARDIASRVHRECESTHNDSQASAIAPKHKMGTEATGNGTKHILPKNTAPPHPTKKRPNVTTQTVHTTKADIHSAQKHKDPLQDTQTHKNPLQDTQNHNESAPDAIEDNRTDIDEIHTLLISEKLKDTVRQARIFTQICLATGYYASALVDTGASVSIIAEGLAKIEGFHVSTDDDLELQGVTGHKLEITGVVHTTARWGHLTRPIKLYVQANASHPIIIGDDIMKEFETHIAYSRNQPPTVTLDGQTVHTWSQNLRGHGAICNINLTTQVQIPAHSTAMVQCLIDKEGLDTNTSHWIWIEPASDATQIADLTIGEALIRTDPDDFMGYIPMINTGDDAIHIETDNIKVEGTEVLDDTPLGTKIRQLVKENEEWIEWQNTGKVPPGLFPPNVTPLEKPTESLQELWHTIRAGVTQKVPNDWFYDLDWTQADITDEQREIAKYFLCQERTAVAKSKYDLGITDVLEHRIELEKNSKPVHCRKRRVPYSDKKAIDDEITRLLALGLIRQSFSEYSSPLIIVYKKDLSKRFCCDLRRVNSLTLMDQYPLPHMDTLIESLSGSEYLTSLDLQSGYWQFPLRESDKHKTAFIVDQGLFEWNVIPQGARTSGATFMRGMQTIFQHIQDIAKVYVDDVIVSTIKPTTSSTEEWELIPTWVRHLWDLIIVLRTVRQARLKFKSKKIIPFKKRTEFLGFIVSGEGIEPSPSKVQTITNAPPPTDLKELRSWLGLIGFYRKHIPNFSRTAVPLNALTNKGASFLWTEECATAFDTLKAKLTEEPVMLVHPDWEKKEYYLYCDASAEGLGVVFAQPDTTYHHRVIAYASRTFKKSERNWPSTERECYAIVWGMRHFWHYISGCHTTVFTDNTAATYLMNLDRCSDDLTGRLARWAMTMQSQRYTLVYKKGNTHLNADALSRHPFVKKTAPDENPNTQETETQETENTTTELALDALEWWVNTTELPEHTHEQLDSIETLPDDITTIEAISAEFLALNHQPSMRFRFTHTIPPRPIINIDDIPYIPQTGNTAYKDGELTIYPNHNIGTITVIYEHDQTHTNQPDIPLHEGDNPDTHMVISINPTTEHNQITQTTPTSEWQISAVDEPTEQREAPTQLQTAQREEEPTKTWIQYLTSNQLPQREKDQFIVVTKCKNLQMSNGTLYYHNTTTTEPNDIQRLRMVIPTSWRCYILKHYHSKGHSGALRTYKTIAEKYYWDHMYADTLKYVKQCNDCVMGKEGPRRREELVNIPVDHPWQIVATDICGPFKETADHNKYIIIFIDYLTNWPEAKAIPDTKAETVIRAFKEIILARHPAPQILISDLGSCYTSKLMYALTCAYGIDHRKAAVRHHQTNGKAEKFIHTLTVGLRILVDSHQTNWDVLIFEILQAYRSTVQTSIGTTPYELLHGFPMTTTEDRATGLSTDTNMRNAATEATLRHIRRNWDQARKQLQKAQATHKKQYDAKKRVHSHSFKVGQKIVIKGPPIQPNLGLSPKLGQPFQGPYTITRVDTPNLEVQYTRGTKTKHKTIHMNDAKILPEPYLGTPTQIQHDIPGPVEFEDTCVYCETEFREQTETEETWIECSTCSRWAHLRCTILPSAPAEHDTWNCIKCDIDTEEATHKLDDNLETETADATTPTTKQPTHTV